MAIDAEAELARVSAALEAMTVEAGRWKARAVAAERARRLERAALERLLTRSLWEITSGANRLAERLESFEGA